MDTIRIRLTNKKAFNILKAMEEMNLIKVLSPAIRKDTKTSKNTSLRGKLNLSESEYKDFQSHVTKIREEWNENF